MLKGTVKWFNSRKGFGFIKQETGEDLFVHYSSISQDGYRFLKDGQDVTFEIEQDGKGPRATNVVPGELPEDANTTRFETKEEE